MKPAVQDNVGAPLHGEGVRPVVDGGDDHVPPPVVALPVKHAGACSNDLILLLTVQYLLFSLQEVPWKVITEES